MYCVNTDICSQKSENLVCPLVFNSVKHQFVKIGYFFIYDECICQEVDDDGNKDSLVN